jgi:hypothetical protein
MVPEICSCNGSDLAAFGKESVERGANRKKLDAKRYPLNARWADGCPKIQAKEVEGINEEIRGAI